jgi:hypothetical protein
MTATAKQPTAQLQVSYNSNGLLTARLRGSSGLNPAAQDMRPCTQDMRLIMTII